MKENREKRSVIQTPSHPASRASFIPFSLSLGRFTRYDFCRMRQAYDGPTTRSPLSCRFDVFGVTETHLTSEIADGEINIEDYSLVRRDRPGRQGGGCAMYYRKSLKVIHRPDLEDDKVEGIFMQVKAGSRDTEVGIIYRPPNHNSEFFTVFPKLLENVWLKFSNIVLLGDFNTNLLQNERGDTSYEGKKMEGILVQFNLKNVIEGPTRITTILKH